VVGGETQPENPAENTVWVNTGIQINKWTVSPTRPTTAIHGDVWVQSKSAGESIDVLDENSLIVGVGGAQQYVTDAWLMTPAQIFVGNEWKELTSDYPVYVRGGSSNAEFSSWTKSGSVTVVNDGGNLQVITNTNIDSDYLIHTTSPINVDDYDTLEVVVEFGDYLVGKNYSHVGLVGSVVSGSTNQTYAAESTFKDGASGGKSTFNIDISGSNLSGEYYIALTGFAVAFTIASITLKK
jgi:membrane-associated protease RseP (regulator of RpoE activity)